MSETKPFKYFAATLGLSGQITLPFQEYIPAQASLQLPDIGGFVQTRVDNFNFRDLIHFDRAIAFASGSFSQKDNAFDATATITIEGLNIFNTITVDRLTARISSSHPADGSEPRILPVGSQVEGLVIAGRKVTVELDVDKFSKLSTFSSFHEALGDDDTRGYLLDELLDEPRDANGFTHCHMVKALHGFPKELEPDIVVCRNTVKVRDFGTVHLAELSMAGRRRNVTMLRFDLGSTPAGSGQAGGSDSNGGRAP